MMLLRLISWPYARKHGFRWLLTVAGIVLGVAVFVGMHTANQSVLAAFQGTIDKIAGKAQLQVTAGEPGFDEEVLDRIRDVPEVRAAAPVIEASVTAGGTSLLILGVDMLGDRNLRDYDLEDSEEGVEDPLVFLAQPDSLMVSKTFADRKGLETGSKLPMRTMTGDEVFVVRGIMKPEGLASAFGGDLAIMDIYSAEKMFGRGRKFDRVDIALQDGVRVDDAARKISAVLGPGFQVQPPSSRGAQFEATTRVYALASDITSLFALFIGMFIIYNTFAIAVTQRRGEIGILRALGATRGQIRTLFLMESALTGLAGTALGILAGLAMARAMAGYIGGFLQDIYGVCARGRRDQPGSEAGSGCGSDGRVDQPDRGRDSGSQRRARGSGEGAAEGAVSIVERRREQGSAAVGARVRVRSAGVAGVRADRPEVAISYAWDF